MAHKKSVNQIALEGRLGKDPDIRYSGSGKAVCKFSLATDRSRKDAQGEWVKETQWHNVVCFGDVATAAQELEKGAWARVEGRVEYRTWEGKDGNKKYSTEIIAQSVSGEEPHYPPATEQEHVEITDSDIPF